MLLKLLLFNTATKSLEYFIPSDPALVKMYVCGPTVYDLPHIGNARSVVVYDVLYRILRYLYGKEKIVYVRNITDVDDKIIIRAKELNITIQELTNKTISDFHNNINYLNCLEPTFQPKVTDNIQEIIEIIQKLLDTKYAYVSNGNIFFEVEKYQDYMKLSNRLLSEMLQGVRIEVSQEKKHPADFVLWKLSEDKDLSYNFNSPWGIGRPGWHIECSAMSYKYLGKNFDIHGGGIDLIFPHHTNEVAQSKCAFEGSEFANFWVHNGFLTVNGEKMSKSLKNFLTVQDLIDKNFPGEVVRLFLLSTNYKQPLDYNDKAIEDAHKMLNYWYRAIEVTGIEIIGVNNEINENFMLALLDDMNTTSALKIINDYAKEIHANKLDHEYISKQVNEMIACANFIGLLMQTPRKWFGEEINDLKVQELVQRRMIAKKNKDWLLADKIRLQLDDMGFIIEDIIHGESKVRKK